MTVDHKNYELLLVDLLDGRLSSGEELALRLFIQGHPELGNWEELTTGFLMLQPEEITFKDKAGLRKKIESIEGIHAGNIEAYCISLCEGLLSKTQITELEDYLSKYPSASQHLEQFQKTYLIPDLSVKYPDKAHLYRKTVWMPAVRRLSYAASVLVLLGLSYWWFRQPSETQLRPILAQTQFNQEMPPKQDEAHTTEKVIVEVVPVIQKAEKPERTLVHEMSPEHSAMQLVYQPAMKVGSKVNLKTDFKTSADDFMLFYFDGQAYLSALGETESADHPGFASLVVRNLLKKGDQLLDNQKRIAGLTLYKLASEDKLSVKGMAEIGMKSLSNLTDGAVDLSVQRDANGKREAYAFRSDPLTVVKSKH